MGREGAVLAESRLGGVGKSADPGRALGGGAVGAEQRPLLREGWWQAGSAPSRPAQEMNSLWISVKYI